LEVLLIHLYSQHKTDLSYMQIHKWIWTFSDGRWTVYAELYIPVPRISWSYQLFHILLSLVLYREPGCATRTG